MENERHYKLRSGSRSRSRTPLVQSHAAFESEIPEHHYDLRSRSRERSHTPGEVTNNKKFDTKILSGNSNKTTDQTTEIMVGREKNVANEALFEDENKQFENSSVSVKKIERRSERQKTKRQIHANGQTDSKIDSCGRKNESRKSSSPHRIITSDYSSEEGERELSDRPSSAHEIYKQAGDWWNVFPKTDYTYSERSQCRYEIAPGVLAMPNMSRRSIHSDTEDFNRFSSDGLSDSGMCSGETSIEKEKRRKAENCTQIGDEFHKSQSSNYAEKSKVQYTKTHMEQYHCHREVIYAIPKTWTNWRSRQLLPSESIWKRIDSRKCDMTSFVDSDTELEEATSNHHNGNRRISQLLMNVSSIIVLWFSKLLKFLNIKTVKRREYHNTCEYQKYESKWLKVWQAIDRPLQYVYFFMVKVFFFDSWLLSRISNIRKWMHQRSPKILWVALLPLLLLAGTCVVQKQSFIRLDSLHNIPYDVTETSNRIFNNIISLTSLQNDLFIEYIKSLTNFSVYFLPGVNVSLPEMP